MIILIERKLVCICIEIPRSDTDGGCQDEVTVTSERHAQAQVERTKKQKRKEKAAYKGGSDKDPEPEDGASLQVHQARAPLADDLSAQGSGLRARQTKGGPNVDQVHTG